MQGILQSQGRLLHKMRFMPSSLSSKSHRLLTALVDSQNKKTVKMRKWFETKDPEKVKQENERVTKSPSLYPLYVMYVHDLFFLPIWTKIPSSGVHYLCYASPAHGINLLIFQLQSFFWSFPYIVFYVSSGLTCLMRGLKVLLVSLFY